MPEPVETMTVAELMSRSGVKFGTSGARGLVASMTDEVCYVYTTGFLQHLGARGEVAPGAPVAIAGDLRSSTPRIMSAVCRAVRDMGCIPVNAGFVPTPALALYGIRHAMPSLMVTGSHIPDDRNGIKFYRRDGEILKEDEAGIRRQKVTLRPDLFDAHGALVAPYTPPAADRTAYREYRDRYLDRLSRDCLAGARIGLYEHSSVAAEVIGELATHGCLE